MEGKNQATSSSFAADLFGSKESSSSSSSSLFNSIFPPPSKAHGKHYISSETTKKNCDFATIQDSGTKEDRSWKPKMDMIPFYEQERSQPCPLSSSLYYGGQDIYPNPHTTKNSHGPSTQYNKEEDDGRASRGNWWQGSLYY